MEYNIDILVAGCNTTCLHCYVDGGKAPEMSFVDFECCMNKLIPVFEKLGEKVSFTLDNEVYNHSDVTKILKFVERNCVQNYYHHGSTTGIAILNHPQKEEIFQILKRNQWMDVSFAIHGGAEVHNKIVHNNEGLSSIIEASKLFNENGFEVWISLMISKEMVNDIPALADVLEKISYKHLLPVIPDYYPTARLTRYQKIRCNANEYEMVVSFLKQKGIDTSSIEEAVKLYNEEYVFQALQEQGGLQADLIRKQLYENETAFFHIDQKLDFYIGNTGSALKKCGNVRECSSDDLLGWILSAEDNYYETKAIHYTDIMDGIEKGNLQLSGENYVYPSTITTVIAMLQNYRNQCFKITEVNRTELNEIYKKLENRMHRIIAPFTSLHKGLDFSCGYYSGHYHKDVAGKYVMDFFPIPVVTVKGLCDIEIDLDKVSVSTKLRREVALSYAYEKLSDYEFESYGVDEYLEDFYVKGNTYLELVKNIENSKEKEIGFSFMFSGDIEAVEIYKLVKFLRKEGFFY